MLSKGHRKWLSDDLQKVLMKSLAKIWWHRKFWSSEVPNILLRWKNKQIVVSGVL